MTVQMVDPPLGPEESLKMTATTDGKRITGTYGSGSVGKTGNSFNVPVNLTDGRPSVFSKKLNAGDRFFKCQSAPILIFKSYDPSAPH